MQQLIVPERIQRELSRVLLCSEQMKQSTEHMQATLRKHGHLVNSPTMNDSIAALTYIKQQLELVREIFEARAGITLQGAKELERIEGDTSAIKEVARRG